MISHCHNLISIRISMLYIMQGEMDTEKGMHVRTLMTEISESLVMYTYGISVQFVSVFVGRNLVILVNIVVHRSQHSAYDYSTIGRMLSFEHLFLPCLLVSSENLIINGCLVDGH